jgi:MFS family permease
VPLARLADLFPRKLIISGAVTFWCLMTGLGGLTASFIQLSATRIGVAVGEAGLVPATHSMIADYFSPRRRATAIAIFSIGLPLGAMLGLFLGGWLNEVTNWRTALMLVGSARRSAGNALPVRPRA